MSEAGGDPPRAPLDVATDLTLSVDGSSAAVDSTGDRVFVRFDTLPGLLRALRSRPAGATDPLTELLTATDLTVELRARDRTVAVAGAGARPSVVAWALGVEPVEVRPDGVLGAASAEVVAGLERVVRPFG